MEEKNDNKKEKPHSERLKDLEDYYRTKGWTSSDEILLEVRNILTKTDRYLVIIGDGMIDDPDLLFADSTMEIWKKYPHAKELLLT